ncbi:hypothetical protein C2845_PM03G06610 [Panicum miliaceum]|uniref:Uncharacterized protein n=1 Tax=Panicum miliaceum TaxID=4540 RepID=A0A3L6TAB5_PANMI|nr:hypothetical protein C2845_PM03G06610 [Panicum miliaceum]
MLKRDGNSIERCAEGQKPWCKEAEARWERKMLQKASNKERSSGKQKCCGSKGMW